MHKLMLAGLGLLTAMAVATPGNADPACGKWQTSFGSLAGEGEAWNANLCVEDSKQNLSFEVTCSGGSLNMRFMPELSEDIGQIDEVTVDYKVDGKSHLVKTQMEELDGALAADMPVNAPLIQKMKVGKQLVISFLGKKSPSYNVPLTGAKAAFTKLEQKCDH